MKRVPEPEVMDDEREVSAYRDGDFAKVNRACARRALRAAGRVKGEALDLGTGPAEIPIFFCELGEKWRVTAVDASARMLEVAMENIERRRLQGRIRLFQGDAKDLVRLRRRFDLVFSNSLLHHLHDPLPFWREVRRLARPGGAVMVQDLLRPATRRAALELVRLHAGTASPLLKKLFFQSLRAAYTLAEVRHQLSQAGISGLTVRRLSDRHLVVQGRIEK